MRVGEGTIRSLVVEHLVDAKRLVDIELSFTVICRTLGNRFGLTSKVMSGVLGSMALHFYILALFVGGRWWPKGSLQVLRRKTVRINFD